MNIHRLQKLYQQYAFIDDGPSEAESVGGAGAEAINIWRTILDRSYEGSKWYFVCFKPFNKAYEKNKEWFAIKGLDHCRKLFKRPQAYLLTRETDATKVHINALVCTSQDVTSLHETSYCNKYKLHAVELLTKGDRRRILTYITKEMVSRTFIKYLDFLTYSRK